MFVITLDDRTYEFDYKSLMNSEAIVLKKVARLTPEQMFRGIATRTCLPNDCDGWTHQPECDPDTHLPCVGCDVEAHQLEQDPECVKALVWLAIRRANGSDCPKFSEFDFDMAADKFSIEDVDPDGAEPDNASGLDPTEQAQTATPEI